MEDKADRYCRLCKKLFCCIECRDRHVDKVHPEVKADCPLCASEILPMRQLEFEKLVLKDEKLLLHIVDKHLPLNCILCGELLKTREDFKSFGSCKWYSQRHQSLTKLSLPRTPAPTGHDEKQKQCSMSDCDYNSNTFLTPPEIYRNTSTPMFPGQKLDFEHQISNVPNFTLKTPGTNSPIFAKDDLILKTHESQNSSRDTKFFSISLHTPPNQETMPFKTDWDKLTKSNSSRIPDIVEKQGKTPNNEIEKITSSEEPTISISYMDLTNIKGGVLQNSSKPSISREEPNRLSDVVKKVRFSDQYENQSDFEAQLKSCAKAIFNTTEEEFHDAHDNTSNAKHINTTDTKDTKDTKDVKNTCDIDNTKEIETTEESQIENKKSSLENSHIERLEKNITTVEKENRSADEVSNILSTVNQRSGSRILTMVLVENNSGKLISDLIPVIGSGLKKLEEQIASQNVSQATSSMTDSLSSANSTSYSRKSITRMELSVSSIESYSTNSLKTVTNHQQVMSSSSSVQNKENHSCGGILSALAQALKFAFKNLSDVASGNIDRMHFGQRQKIVDRSKFSAEPSIEASLENVQVRPGKRSRDVTDTSSMMDSVAFAIDGRSPLAKRQKGWYKIKGREPISRMRSNHGQVKSSRGLSSETQVFSQGSLTVGDTVLPLPARAHQSTQTE